MNNENINENTEEIKKENIGEEKITSDKIPENSKYSDERVYKNINPPAIKWRKEYQGCYRENNNPQNPCGGYCGQNVNNFGYNNGYYSPSGGDPARGYTIRDPFYREREQQKSKAYKAFVIISLCAIFFFIGIILTNYRNGKRVNLNQETGESYSEKNRAVGDDTQMIVERTPESDTNKTVNGKLTPSAIAEKCRKSNVGILTYSSGKYTGQGSGVVMSYDSTKTYTYIITCAHVIDLNGAKIKVQAAGGAVYDAELVGYDTRTDLGVIRVKDTSFTCAEFGDSDALKVGDAVYSVGNPGGTEFFGSFTGGLVSDINRPVNSSSGYTSKCIQHDAAINPGNSGGMLVNEYGQVIGINSQKIASEEYEGMGFAIPVNVAKPVIDNLIKLGYVPDRAKLGIKYYPLSASQTYTIVAQVAGLPSGSIIIGDTSGNEQLAAQGVQKYDLITAVNGKELDTADVLLEVIESGKPGDEIKLTIVRIGDEYKIEKFNITVKLVEDTGITENSEVQSWEYRISPFENPVN